MSAPSTFADFAALPGVGAAYYVNVSLDNFATQFKNYSTVAMQFGPTLTIYDPRILSMGNVSRAFGAQRGFASGTFSLELDNTDGGCDWLINRTTYASQALRAKFELYVVLYLPGDFATRSVKQLGTFMLMDPPTRTGEKVSLSLADDSLGEVATLHRTPSVRDWMNITDANRPTLLSNFYIDRGGEFLVPNFDYDAPTQLLFGSNAHPIQRVAANCYIICAVAGSAGSLPMGVRSIILGDGGVLEAKVSLADGPPTQSTYTVRRTPDITVDGRTFHLLWVDIDVTASYTGSTQENATGMMNMLRDRGFEPEPDQGTGNIGIAWSIHDQIAPVTVVGYLLSHPDDSDVSESQSISCATVAQDLLTYYARRENPSIDTGSFDSVRSARPNISASGAIDAGFNPSNGITTGGRKFYEQIDGSLVQALRGICAIGAFDLYVDWSGAIKATALISDYDAQTATFATLDEVDLLAGSISEKIPSTGERNAAYNRLFFSALGGRFGPYDDKVAIASWGKIVAIEVNGDWFERNDLSFLVYNGTTPRLPSIQNTPYAPASSGGSIIRPVVTCRTFLNGLNFELGDYLYFSWSRGVIGGPYANSTMRVEGIVFDPMSCTVELTLLWVDDLRSVDNLPYLLDDETLNVRCAGSGGRTATVTGGSATVTFSSGNLVSDGVTAIAVTGGDQLIVRDAADTAFVRNQVFPIVARTTNTVTLAAPVGGSGSHVLSTWEIQAGAMTYRTGVPYFGKTSQDDGLFSDGATVANQLLEG